MGRTTLFKPVKIQAHNFNACIRMGEGMACGMACETCINQRMRNGMRTLYAEWQVVTSTFGDPMKAQVNNSAVNLVIVFNYGKSVKILT